MGGEDRDDCLGCGYCDSCVERTRAHYEEMERTTCEGCGLGEAVRWTDDDVHLCWMCYGEIPPVPSPDTRRGS